MSLEEKLSNIERHLKNIERRLAVIEQSCSHMDSHIFIVTPIVESMKNFLRSMRLID